MDAHLARKRLAGDAPPQPAPKRVELLAFRKASAYYGSRKGYVFKMGDEGLGYYLDDKQLAKERALEGLEGPGIPQTAPVAAADSDDERDAAPAAPGRAAIISAADLPSPAAKPAAAFDPYADLPPPAAKAPPKPKAAAAPAPAAAAGDRGPVKVFAPGLFKLEKVHCLHVVRKHRDSRNPTSWRNPAKRVTRSVDDATDELRIARSKLLAAPSYRREDLFKELAKAQSDCGSAKKGGDLGFFRRGKMSPPFEVAAFNLDVGELSKTVASSSGVHLIYRVA